MSTNLLKKNYFKVPNRVFEYGLSCNAMSVYYLMLSGDENFNPSMGYLCRNLGLSRSTVTRAINELLEANFINRLQKGSLGKISTYELVPPKYWRKND